MKQTVTVRDRRGREGKKEKKTDRLKTKKINF